MNSVQTSRRADLLRIGRQLFAERAYDALSIDDIAASAGIAKGLLYYYFGSKRGFYVAVVEDALAEQADRIRTDPALPPAEQLRAAIEAHLDYVVENAAGYLTLMDGGIGSDPEVKAILDRHMDDRVTEIGRMLTGSRDISPVLRTALHGWFGFGDRATVRWLTAGDITREQLRDLHLQSFAVVQSVLLAGT